MSFDFSSSGRSTEEINRLVSQALQQVLRRHGSRLPALVQAALPLLLMKITELDWITMMQRFEKYLPQMREAVASASTAEELSKKLEQLFEWF